MEECLIVNIFSGTWFVKIVLQITTFYFIIVHIKRSWNCISASAMKSINTHVIFKCKYHKFKIAVFIFIDVSKTMKVSNTRVFNVITFLWNYTRQVTFSHSMIVMSMRYCHSCWRTHPLAFHMVLSFLNCPKSQVHISSLVGRSKTRDIEHD